MESPSSIFLMEKDGEFCLAVEVCQDELPLLLLSAGVTLTNVCNLEQLQKIPKKLTEAFLLCVKQIWSHVRNQRLANEVIKYSKRKRSCLSSITTYKLAESIFRLSLYVPGLISSMPSDTVTGYLFQPRSSSYMNFITEHWESSPILIREQLKEMDLRHDIFSSSNLLLGSEALLPGCLSSLLQGMVSCPPISLDQLDSLSFLDDIRDTVGCPLIYQQDIRVVKTKFLSRTEEHYFHKRSKGLQAPLSFSGEDISKCEIAFREGYSVALRGMEYRLKSVADITRVVAALFGQPSVGANLYVTPPDSQGLACHYDDHCVLVCQLRGTKQWTVYMQPVVQLPRLYEHLEVPEELHMEKKQVLLREGDVLYIPRGFAHEAVTDCTNSECSAHITLAVEIEPPFEWEGFAHVALHQWSHGVKSDEFSSDPPGILQAVSANLLHVAIRLISSSEPLFRKACLVAASSLPPKTEEWLDQNQRAIFNQVIIKISELANFADSLNFVEMAVQGDEDPFEWLRWLEHLDGREGCAHNLFGSTSAEICKIIPFIYEHRDNAEVAFVHLKSKFCNEIHFDDVKVSYENLHTMYKEARMQYMNGMISLHY